MARAGEDRLTALLDLVYDASTDPQAWPVLLGSLGSTLREPADAQQVALQTVRTQLQSIFDKTDTRRQPELVRALMSALAVVTPRPDQLSGSRPPSAGVVAS